MKSVTPDVNFPALEKDMLAFWQKNKVFEKSNIQRHGAPTFTFYDGPPFANGLPHYGHILANTIKDSVPRYWVMRGYYVERRFGWDCHGVPVEFEVEKNKQIKGRADILAMGVDKFNEECRRSVQHYTEEWQRTITRIGRWVDWSNQYRTMDLNFMESVWWVFSQLFEKGLVYRDFKVVPYSPRITAVLSNFEANQNYKEVQDPAVTVKMKLVDEDAYLLAWTTTPWTLISNLAVCIGPDIGYVKVKDEESGEVYYLAESRLDYIYKKGKKTGGYEVLKKVAASELTGRKYLPLFPYFKNQANAFHVLSDAYVTVDDGTGIVHQAPAYGEDDFRVCREAGIALVDPVDEEGKFKAEIPEFAGQFVKDADKDIMKLLKERNQLLRHDTIVHSYPFCERTDTPLIYKAIQTWYVAVEKIKDRLVANNQKINWVPEHLKDGRMGKWLENARDWAISRNRFWGTPIPIWMCAKNDEHLKIVGSVADLEKLSGAKVMDLHNHHIDKLTFKCPNCDGTMRRIPEVFDCWFESGSMPYAQNHYPFENKESFESKFPADFIAEGLDQTRGWFYTLSVLSTALFDSPAFKNVVVNGLVLAEDGKKMSKRLKNYTPPEELLDRLGSDSVRLYMLNSAVLKAGDLAFTDQGVRDTTRAVLLPLWNAYSFLSTYAEADKWAATKSLIEGIPPEVSGELDRWIISRFQTLCDRVHEQMEHYRLYNVVPQVLSFIEDLTNWYIRLSRKRFWGSGTGGKLTEDTTDAYATLTYVMAGFSKVFAPFAPFISEKIYQSLADGIVGVPESVHLCNIPVAREELIDAGLENRMDLLRRATTLGRSLRAKHQIKTRQVLPSMLVITRNLEDQRAITDGATLLKSELNIKEIEYSNNEPAHVHLSLKPNLKTLGKKMGRQLNDLKVMLEKLNENPADIARMLAEIEDKGQINLLGFDLIAEDFLIGRGPKDERLIATEKGITVLLDTRLTEELILEGLGRELVNRIQKLRKDSGLQVSDRIKVVVTGTGKIEESVNAFSGYIAKEVLASKLEVHETFSDPDYFATDAEIEDYGCRIYLKISQ
jgi:isoleucyl-tRNA synthetase